METKRSVYLDIQIEMTNGKRIKMSLPNDDVTVADIVHGLISKNYLDENIKYKMMYMLNHDDRVYDIVQDNNDLFVILDDIGLRKENEILIDKKKVFIIHGHKLSLKDTVARLLEKVGANPVVLVEEPSRGMTIIEKIENHSDVGYAVVLMTGDDRGGKKDTSFKDQKIRARQNVIFELGYFLSKLDRDRVCVLYESGVEIPSDYSGVIYIELDQSDGWKMKLVKELKAVGLDIVASHMF